jgi:hypothetical protein
MLVPLARLSNSRSALSASSNSQAAGANRRTEASSGLQALDHLAGFMSLTSLNRRVRAKDPMDRLAQRLGAVDDEQPALLGIERAGAIRLSMSA